jgi:hypothetical protein
LNTQRPAPAFPRTSVAADPAVEGVDPGTENGEEAPHEVAPLFRVHSVGEIHRADDVDEQDRDLLALSFRTAATGGSRGVASAAGTAESGCRPSWDVPSRSPHAWQNGCPPGFGAPQWRHGTVWPSGAPQVPQKRADWGFGCPHAGHTTVARSR